MPTVPQRWPAPGKLNLFLHITGRQADGYHHLQTVYQFFDFCDWLTFEVRNDGRVRRVGPVAGVAEEADLTVRAARLLQAHAGCRQGVDIRLEKNLPLGGGVGGGSSDAATTLVVLNRLWRLDLPREQLMAMALQLGADVPVFVFGRAAWAEGRGERLREIDVPEPWMLLLFPPCQVSTAELFADPQLTRDVQPIKIRDFLSGRTGNVFEARAAARFPEIHEGLEWLRRFGDGRMSGTGATLFLPCESRCQGEAIAAQRPFPWPARVVKAVNRSPLWAAVEVE